MNRTAVVDFMKSLTRSELAMLVAEVTEQWTEGSLVEGRTSYLLTQCFVLEPSPTTEPVVLLPIGFPTDTHPEEPSDPYGLHYTGPCHACRVDVLSGSKYAICPCCGRKVGCS